MEQAGLLCLDRESFTVWPCLRESYLGDWLLRFGGGVYGRSNSVQPYGAPDRDLESAIDHCQALYEAEGLRPMFRLPDLLGTDELDAALARRGYEISEPTYVMTGVTEGFAMDPEVRLDSQYDEAWFNAYLAGSGRGVGRQAAVAGLMDRVAAPRRFARIAIDGKIASNGLGVIHNGVLWLFGIATVPEFRRQGLADRLVRSLVAWGAEEGASKTALQVSIGNQAAVPLYSRMGMQKAYGYHYRRL